MRIAVTELMSNGALGDGPWNEMLAFSAKTCARVISIEAVKSELIAVTG
jgi:hypothetical protein